MTDGPGEGRGAGRTTPAEGKADGLRPKAGPVVSGKGGAA